ncbi:MAG: chemotaxis protein CheW [Silvanigrellaceae bacterium]|nr:chemotaxis protein CheW [Silvanigrellaceae bacterium]
MLDENKSVLQEFIIEAEEIHNSILNCFLNLNKQKDTTSEIKFLYRSLHTLKGTSQIFGFNQLSILAHAFESLIEVIKNQQKKIDDEVQDLFLLAFDIIKKHIENIKKTGRDLEGNEEQIHIFSQLYDYSILQNFNMSNWIPKDSFFTLQKNTDYTNYKQEQYLSRKETMATQSSIEKEKKESLKTRETTEQSSSTIRVNVETLNNLMNFAGELVLIRNQMLQFAKISENQELLNLGHRLNIVTGEMQNEIMKTRMQPVGNVFSNFNRVVRDLSKELDKKIDLVIEGAETELDKSLIEAIKDPLTHILRNSIDHGIEPKNERQNTHKSEVGQIKITAFHENGQVVIEVSDDGRGLSANKIGHKAVEKGVITEQQLGVLSEKEIQALIFAPGFSTAEKISNVSGRGVGMDVVKTNIEHVGGFVELQSIEGSGTTIRLKIPLTLAIIPTLIVKAAQEKFAIPQAKLLELVRIDPESENGLKIEILQGKPVFILRGKLIPLLYLAEVFQFKSYPTIPSHEVLYIAVLTSDKGHFGLVIDDILDSTDIVVKPLPSILKDLGYYSGATVLGDGSICLTIDILGLCEKTGVITHAPKGNDTAPLSSEQNKLNNENNHNLLYEPVDYVLVDISSPGNYAIPLTLIHRLEEFETKDIEFSAEQRVINYRNSLLPIISLKDFLHIQNTEHKDQEKKINDKQKTSIVVIKSNERYIGIEVDKIIDIKSISGTVDTSIADRVGILGSLIASENILVLIDVFAVIKSCVKNVASSINTTPIHQNSPSPSFVNQRPMHSTKKILLVEDNSFLRKHISQILNENGYEVDMVVDGVKALEYLHHRNPDDLVLIISDIEMPNLDGIELAKKIRENHTWDSTPLIALTTHYSEKRIQIGLEAGFNKYLQKLDVTNIITEINHVLGK